MAAAQERRKAINERRCAWGRIDWINTTKLQVGTWLPMFIFERITALYVCKLCR